MSEEVKTALAVQGNESMMIQNTNAELQARIERLFTDTQLDAMFMKKAEIMAKSNMLPGMYRGDQYACYALQQLAFVWQTNPMLLAPGLYKVKPDSPLTLDGKTVKSIVGRFAPVKDHFIADEYFGDWSKVIGKFKMIESKKATDDYGRPKKYRIPAWTPEDEEGLGIRLTATLNSGIEIKYELLLTQCQTRNSMLWGEDQQLQMYYRAIARFSRKYFPEILNGMYIREEFDEENVIDVTPESGSAPEGKTKTERLKKKLIGVKAEDPKKPEEKPAEQTVPDLKKFITDYIEKSGAPVTLEMVEDFLKKERKVTEKLNTPEFPKKWADWIIAKPDVLMKYVFAWGEKQAAEAEAANTETQGESGKLL